MATAGNSASCRAYLAPAWQPSSRLQTIDRQLAGNFQAVVKKLSGKSGYFVGSCWTIFSGNCSSQTVVRKSVDNRQALVRPGSRKSIVRQFPGSFQAAYRQAVFRQPTGSWQAVAWQFSGHCQAIIFRNLMIRNLVAGFQLNSGAETVLAWKFPVCGLLATC